jgi:hypothetical protein
MKFGTKLNFTLAATVIVLLLIGGWFLRGFLDETRTETIHSSIVERVEAIGKLELVKYTVQDVVEHRIVNRWMPDVSALLIVQCEAAGCIDMTKVAPDDIVLQGDRELTILLPLPELAYCKINHEKSRVYGTKNVFMSGAQIVDDAYRAAERQIANTVMQTGILEQTKTNAVLFFDSFFHSLGFKFVRIEFKQTE